jgi:hypothetical protein
VSGLGRFAPLADPVADASGNVFLGTTDGHVFALHADGSPFWDRELPSFDGILTSPAVASDGSVFVVGGYPPESIRDHRHDTSNVRDHRSTYHLYRFLPGGQPDINATTPIPVINDRGPMALESIGRPAMWHLGNDEAVIVTALYSTFGGTDLHVFAFSPDGGLVADWMVHQQAGAVTASGGLLDFLFPGFTPGWFGPLADPPLPGVAIAAANGGDPYIVLVDPMNRALIGLAYMSGPTPHFEDQWRTGHGGYELLSPPAMLRDWHSAVGIKNGVVFGGPSGTPRPDLTFISTQSAGFEDVFAAPIPAADGRTIAVTGGGEIIGFTDAVLSRVDFDDRTIAPAATSKNHVYVATYGGLHTLDATGSAIEASYAWSNGGVWAPVVGPQGHVYAMADHTLHVFAPPSGPRVPRDRVIDGIDVNPR